MKSAQEYAEEADKLLWLALARDQADPERESAYAQTSLAASALAELVLNLQRASNNERTGKVGYIKGE